MLNERLIDLFPHLSALDASMPNYRLTDLLLFAVVLIGMPAYSIISGRKFARTSRDEISLVGRYRWIIARAVLISALILSIWYGLGRPYSALGLETDIGLPGRLGFGIDILFACYLAYVSLKSFSPEKLAAMRKALESLHIAPQTRMEFAVFPFVILFGSAMEELLYRGYLFWALTPVAGLWGAATISSVAFGVAHAYQGWAGILRTTLIGLAFAVCFALTHSLWWLLLMHIMMNMSGNIVAWKVRRLSATPAQ